MYLRDIASTMTDFKCIKIIKSQWKKNILRGQNFYKVTVAKAKTVAFKFLTKFSQPKCFPKQHCRENRGINWANKSDNSN